MNEATQRKINEGLALVMGLQEIPDDSRWYALNVPDYFTDNAEVQQAKTDLLSWMSKQTEPKIRQFHLHLVTLLGLRDRLRKATDWDADSLIRIQCATPARVATAAALAVRIVAESEVK